MLSKYVRIGRNVRRLIRSLGGKVVFKKRRYDSGFANQTFNCPFSQHLGMDWEKGVIYWRLGEASNPEAITGAIHEAGHIFTQKFDPNNYVTSPVQDEILFLGWELRASAQCGLTLENWQEYMGAYALDTFIKDDEECDVQDLSLSELRKLYAKALKLSTETGLIGPGNVVVSVRTDL